MKNKSKTKSVDNQMEAHLKEKRDELIWALSIQDYNGAQIGRVFNIHPATVMRIIRQKPESWQPKWKKVQD